MLLEVRTGGCTVEKATSAMQKKKKIKKKKRGHCNLQLQILAGSAAIHKYARGGSPLTVLLKKIDKQISRCKCSLDFYAGAWSVA